MRRHVHAVKRGFQRLRLKVQGVRSHVTGLRSTDRVIALAVHTHRGRVQSVRASVYVVQSIVKRMHREVEPVQCGLQPAQHSRKWVPRRLEWVRGSMRRPRRRGGLSPRAAAADEERGMLDAKGDRLGDRLAAAAPLVAADAPCQIQAEQAEKRPHD